VWRDDEVLLVQRGKVWGRGFWSLPGGKIEANEAAQAAAVRELEEETGLRAALTHHVGDFGLDGPDVYYQISCWTGHYNGGAAIAGDDAMAVKWVRWDSLSGITLAFNNEEAIRQARVVLGL
jgi:8-oxo-dGTP diphosphatase